MLHRFLVFSTFVAASLAASPCILNAQVYFEDFESADIGDTVSSLGIIGQLGDYLVDSVGVDGSHGFEAVIDENINWQFGYLPVDFSLHDIGDVLTVMLDAQISLTSENTYTFPTGLFDFEIRTGNNAFLSQFQIHDETNSLMLAHSVWGNDVEQIFDINVGAAPLAEIELNTIPGQSSFFTFRIDFYKRATGDINFATSVVDMQGNEITRYVNVGVDMDAVFTNPQYARLTAIRWPIFESVRFDNIGYEVRSVMLGDVNRDGAVDLLDVMPLVELLASGQYQLEADVNQDGYVNLLDVGNFVDIID